MRSKPFLALSMACALLSNACVPSFSSLVTARRYGDAICHATTSAEAESLVRAVERDADVRLTVYAAHDNELEAALGDKGKEIAEKVTFLRVKSVINDLPSQPSLTTSMGVSEKDRALYLGRGGTPTDASAAVLFALTGETLPGSHSEIDEQKLAREVGWAVFTFGLKQLLFGTDKNISRTVDPSAADYARSGPKAMAILDGVSRGEGVNAFAIPRSLEGSAYVKLSMFASSTHEDYGMCSLAIDQTIPLSRPGSRLTEVVDASFRNAPRHPSELNATRVYRLHNPYGSWSNE